MRHRVRKRSPQRGRVPARRRTPRRVPEGHRADPKSTRGRARHLAGVVPGRHQAAQRRRRGTGRGDGVCDEFSRRQYPRAGIPREPSLLRAVWLDGGAVHRRGGGPTLRPDRRAPEGREQAEAGSVRRLLPRQSRLPRRPRIEYNAPLEVDARGEARAAPVGRGDVAGWKRPGTKERGEGDAEAGRAQGVQGSRRSRARTRREG